MKLSLKITSLLVIYFFLGTAPLTSNEIPISGEGFHLWTVQGKTRARLPNQYKIRTLDVVSSPENGSEIYFIKGTRAALFWNTKEFAIIEEGFIKLNKVNNRHVKLNLIKGVLWVTSLSQQKLDVNFQVGDIEALGSQFLARAFNDGSLFLWVKKGNITFTYENHAGVIKTFEIKTMQQVYIKEKNSVIRISELIKPARLMWREVGLPPDWSKEPKFKVANHTRNQLQHRPKIDIQRDEKSKQSWQRERTVRRQIEIDLDKKLRVKLINVNLRDLIQ